MQLTRLPEYLWEKVNKDIFQSGLSILWNACKPEMLPFMPENLRFYAGDGER